MHLKTISMNNLIQIVGFLLIYFASDIGRKDCCEIDFFSWEKLIQIILILVGILLITIPIQINT